MAPRSIVDALTDDALNTSHDVIEMMDELVHGVASEPCHGAWGRRREVVDADPLPLCIGQAGQFVGEGVGVRAKGLANVCDVLLVITLFDGAFVAPHRRKVRLVVGEREPEPIALHHQNVTTMARVLERRPHLVCGTLTRNLEDGGTLESSHGSRGIVSHEAGHIVETYIVVHQRAPQACVHADLRTSARTPRRSLGAARGEHGPNAGRAQASASTINPAVVRSSPR